MNRQISLATKERQTDAKVCLPFPVEGEERSAFIVANRHAWRS